jgi:hypothetical protein
LPNVQSPSAPHWVPQPLPEHAYGEQSLVCAGGHVGPEPVHLAAGVATFAEQLATRHCVDDGKNASAGQVATRPSQDSAVSQTSIAGRQTVPAAASVFVGQAAAVPVHASATSQGPAAVRHRVAAGLNVF